MRNACIIPRSRGIYACAQRHKGTLDLERTGTLRVTFEMALGRRNVLTVEPLSGKAWEHYVGTWGRARHACESMRHARRCPGHECRAKRRDPSLAMRGALGPRN